jgi:hypothetical protein
VKPKVDTAIRTHDQVAAILTRRGFPMCGKTVRNIEKQALRKIRKALIRDWRFGRYSDDDI